MLNQGKSLAWPKKIWGFFAKYYEEKISFLAQIGVNV